MNPYSMSSSIPESHNMQTRPPLEESLAHLSGIHRAGFQMVGRYFGF